MQAQAWGCNFPPSAPLPHPLFHAVCVTQRKKHTTQQRADEENMQQEACSGERRVAQAVGDGCQRSAGLADDRGARCS